MSLAFLLSTGLTAVTVAAAPVSSHQIASAHTQEIGETVVVNDIDGNEVGTATIDDIVDPFEDADQSPQRGLRFLSVVLSVENTGDDTLTVEPANIGIIDDSGIIYVDNPEITRTDRQEQLTTTDLAPGDSISGSLEVGFPEDSAIAQIIWLVGTGQLPILLDNLDPVALGDPVTLFTTDYTEEAVITTEDVVDNFDDVTTNADPGRGNKFVGVTVTIENVGDNPLTPVPGSVFLTTSDGIFWAPLADDEIERSRAAARRTPYLTDEPIDPGDSVTSFIGYAVPEDLDIRNVFYLPDSARLIRIYDPQDESANDSTPGADDKGNTGPLGPIGKKTPTPKDDTGNTGNTGDECAGAKEWADLTIETLGKWGDVFQGLDLQNPTAETKSQIQDGIDTIREQADILRESTPPPAAEQLSDMIIQAYEDSADALEQVIEGIDSGDDSIITDALMTISDIGTSFQSGDVADVLAEAESACPDLSDL
jgi:hypothetical protein